MIDSHANRIYTILLNPNFIKLLTTLSGLLAALTSLPLALVGLLAASYGLASFSSPVPSE
jgi:hypothetical protein